MDADAGEGMSEREAGRDIGITAGLSEVMANARPTVYEHPEGGYAWTLCLDCEAVDVRVDEDGCCTACGMDALCYGRAPLRAAPDAELVREALSWLREEESTFRLYWENPAKTAERSPEADARRRRMYEVRATALRLAERGAAIEEGS